jgi:hypothetical protein
VPTIARVPVCPGAILAIVEATIARRQDIVILIVVRRRGGRIDGVSRKEFFPPEGERDGDFADFDNELAHERLSLKNEP